MDSELKTYLEGMEQRTVARIAEVEQRIMERVDGRLDAVEDRLKAHVTQQCERVETSLLTEFHKWGRTSDQRTRQALETASALSERMLTAAEDRISELERRRQA